MRIQHWILPAIGLMATLFGGRHASAQYDPTRVVPADAPYIANAPATPFPYDARAAGPHPGPFGPGQVMYASGPGQPPMAVAPGQPPMPPATLDFLPSEAIQTHHSISVDPEGSAGMPPQFQPWPGISPYDHRFQEHYSDRGLWFQNINDEPDKVFFSVDAYVASFREPAQRLIGAPNIDPDPVISNSPSSEGVIAWRSRFTREEDTFNHFESAVGLQMRLGVIGADESGIELKGFWTGDFEDVNHFGALGAGSNPALLTVLNPGIALDDGSDGGPGTNTNSVMDEFAEYTYGIQSAGASLTRWVTPFVKQRSFLVRRTYGIRYMGIEERFNVIGADSGFGYLVPDPPFVHPDPTTVVPAVDRLQLTMLSTTTTHLVGPEIGIQFEVGGDTLSLTSESKVGLMANRETMHLEGGGLGNHFFPGYTFTTFSRDRDHTHVSPLFEQSLNFDFQAFEYVPFLNRMSLFEHASIRAGYTFIAVGQVVRPTDTIIYNAPPDNPGLTARRTHVYHNAWNFGIEWTR
ncbi:MAG: hypothetical protein WD648_06660 [Planctomycetaceae bacterium]